LAGAGVGKDDLRDSTAEKQSNIAAGTAVVRSWRGHMAAAMDGN
jgi:hypothetical protein